jgi:hypothetical protein
MVAERGEYICDYLMSTTECPKNIRNNNYGSMSFSNMVDGDSLNLSNAAFVSVLYS